MKKLSTLLCMLLLSIVCGGTAWAQVGEKLYRATRLVSGMEDLQPGKDYALKGTGISPSNSNYLCVPMAGNAGSAELTGDCIYQFEQAGVVDGRQTYYLVQKSTGEYLRRPHMDADGVEGESWSYPNSNTPEGWGNDCLALTSDKSQAWQFFAHTADLQNSGSLFGWAPKDPNTDISSADTMYVFASANPANNTADTYRYLASWSAGHSFMAYHDTNVWNLWTDIEEVRGLTRLNHWVTTLLANGPEGSFTPGETYGSVPQEAYDELVNVFNRVIQFIEAGTGTEDEADALCDELLEAYETCATTVVMPETGKYYYITGNEGRTSGSDKATMYGTASGWLWDYQPQPVTDLNHAIKLLPGSTEGTYRLYSPYYEKYMGAINGNSNMLLMVDSTEAADYILGHTGGQYFYLTNAGISQGLHAAESGKQVVGWNYTTPASHWTFQLVPDDEAANIDALAAQMKLNTALNDLYDEASAAYMAGRAFTSAATADTLYESHGLLTSTDQIFSSPLANGDGNGISILLNGRLTGAGEYMHTTWSSGNAPNYYHFVGADLKKAVSAVTVKFSNRIDGAARNEHPTKFRVYVCNDAKVAADTVAPGASWTWVGDVVPTLANDTIADTWVASIDFDGDYQYIRLDVIETANNKSIAPAGGNSYPFFYMSELGIYEATYDPENSPYESVPEADGKALGDALADARKEIEVEKATQPTIDQLQSAYDKFLESYADPQVAIDAIAEAQEMLDSAEVGTGLGQVQQAPYDALKQAITDSEAKIKTIMQLTDIQAIVDDLQAKRDAMAASAVMPETGKYYWIVSQGTGRFNAAIGASNNADGAALLQGAVIEVEGMPNTFDEATAQTNYEYVWYLGEDADGTQYLRNVATGYYMNGNTTTDMTTTKEKAQGSYQGVLRQGRRGSRTGIVQRLYGERFDLSEQQRQQCDQVLH